MMTKALLFGFSLAAGLSWALLPPAHAKTREIVFPVLGITHFSDDFGDPRSGGRTHEGNDIFGAKMQPLVAAADGTVWYVPYPEPSWGYSVTLRDKDGYEYRYFHINNDHPGTDDGRGGGRNAYAPYMKGGLPVQKGQRIGWMGDSGNAEKTAPHLHFEIRDPDGTPINPYDSLRAATHLPRSTTPPPLDGELLPFGQFTGGASVAAGEYNGMPTDTELLVGAGPGGGPQVRIFRQDGTIQAQFFVFAKDFRGGIDVAAGDVDGDGIDEIIATPLDDASPLVRVLTKEGLILNEFFAYGESFKGGLHVAAADLNGDGRAEIVTGPNRGGGPQVRIFRPDGSVITQFFAYGKTFRGGIDVAAIPANGDSPAMIATGAGPGGGPHVRVFTPQGTLITQFFPYNKEFHGGVRVAFGDIVDSIPGPEIATAPADRGGPDYRVYGADGSYLKKLTSFERWWTGGYDLATADGQIFIASGPGGRRASIRTIANISRLLSRETFPFPIPHYSPD